MTNFNPPYLNPSAGMFPTPAQPNFPTPLYGGLPMVAPWQFNAPAPYYPPPPRHHGMGLFFFFTSLWLGGRAFKNHQRALEAEQRLENMRYVPTGPREPYGSPRDATNSVIPDYYDVASSSSSSLTEPKTTSIAQREPLHARIIDAAFGDGMFLVGVDIEPGTYRCEGLPGRVVYWERVRSASGESLDRICNRCGPGPWYATIERGEFFYSERSGGWTRIVDGLGVIEGETDEGR
jgi:hypothetical protein